MSKVSEVHIPHVGWLSAPGPDRVLGYLAEGWFEYRDQAFLWLLLRPDDCVVDCGSHLGLYSVLAARAMGGRGRILSIEPNPELVAALEANLATNDVDCVQVLHAAAFSKTGPLTLHLGPADRSAWASVYAQDGENREVTVPGVTIDEVLEEANIGRVDFLKMDVEGAEMDALAGCRRSIEAGRLPLVSVEFSEPVLNAAGRSTPDLAGAWIEHGYVFHRLDVESLTLAEVEFDGPVWYENLYAVRDRAWIDERLADVPAERLRVARDMLIRGAAAAAMNEERDRLQNAVTELTKHLESRSHLLNVRDEEVRLLRAELVEAQRTLTDRLARYFVRRRSRGDERRRESGDGKTV